jgi:multidrug resistance efflux pump
MEMLLLALYILIAWLIFFKFKLLPWNNLSRAIVVTIPVVGLATLILLLNVFAPSSADVRVIKPVIQIVSQVRGRVISVDVAPNELVKKGTVLFKVDPTPYALQVATLEAQLVGAQSSVAQLQAQRHAAANKVFAAQAQLALAVRRVTENRALVSQSAGDRFTLEQAETTLKEAQANLAGAQSEQAQVEALLNGRVNGQPYQVAQISAQLADARWDLEQTVVRAPADGYAINLQLRPGSFVGSLPISPVLSFVENQQQVIALYQQNELYAVQPGNRAEFTLRTIPGRIIHAHVNSIVWAQSQGQFMTGGALPSTGLVDPYGDRFVVKLDIDARDRDLFMAAGAVGDGAIYTDRFEALHLVRMVLLRITAKLNYLVLKLH